MYKHCITKFNPNQNETRNTNNLATTRLLSSDLERFTDTRSALTDQDRH